ncbi:MAG: Rieske 2Fe-2S domain-containing protein [Candidatus Saccharibacteria bacterium]|nr:Rieske 2Fe-2S domain-containing protein [Pseudorhodobacter sp.]
MTGWTDICALDDIEPEDVMRCGHDGRSFAICRALDGAVFATDGHCPHEQVHLAKGLVIDDTIACPKYSSRFNYRAGAALHAPVCVALGT